MPSWSFASALDVAACPGTVSWRRRQGAVIGVVKVRCDVTQRRAYDSHTAVTAIQGFFAGHMDAHVERLLARVAADELIEDFNARDWERLYHIAMFDRSQDVVPSQGEVKTQLLLFGCSYERATILSQQFSHLCSIIQSGDQERGR